MHPGLRLGYGIPPSSPGASVASARSRQALIGWTAPTVIYDSMRAIKADADKLNTLVGLHVPEGPFKSSWRAWYANWNAFFDKYQTPGLAGDTDRLGAVFYTDDLAARVKTYSQELANITADYNRQRQADGAPVPQVTPPPVQDPRSTDDRGEGRSSGSSLPWWFWVGATIAAGGLLYWGYRRYQDVQHTKRVLHREILPGLIGPRLARAAEQSGDARDLPLPMLHAKDPQRFASAMGLFYRPYDHPHLVPSGGEEG